MNIILTPISLIYWYIKALQDNVNYYKYIRSRAWRFRRKLRLIIARNRCEYRFVKKGLINRRIRCRQTKRLEGHHKRYKDEKGHTILGRENVLIDIIILCKSHHEKIHNIN